MTCARRRIRIGSRCAVSKAEGRMGSACSGCWPSAWLSALPSVPRLHLVTSAPSLFFPPRSRECVDRLQAEFAPTTNHAVGRDGKSSGVFGQFAQILRWTRSRLEGRCMQSRGVSAPCSRQPIYALTSSSRSTHLLRLNALARLPTTRAWASRLAASMAGTAGMMARAADKLYANGDGATPFASAVGKVMPGLQHFQAYRIGSTFTWFFLVPGGSTNLMRPGGHSHSIRRASKGGLAAKHAALDPVHDGRRQRYADKISGQ